MAEQAKAKVSLSMGIESLTIEQMILKDMDEGRANTMRGVICLLGEKYTEAEILEAVKRLENEEKIKLNHNIPTHYSFIQYLKNADYNLWLYLVLLASLGTLATIYLTLAIHPLVIARWVLGSFFLSPPATH